MKKKEKPTYAQDPNQCSLCGDIKDVEPGRYCRFCGARYMNAWIAYGYTDSGNKTYAFWVIGGCLVSSFIGLVWGLPIIAGTVICMFRKKDKLKRTMVWSREFAGENYFQ